MKKWNSPAVEELNLEMTATPGKGNGYGHIKNDHKNGKGNGHNQGGCGSPDEVVNPTPIIPGDTEGES